MELNVNPHVCVLTLELMTPGNSHPCTEPQAPYLRVGITIPPHWGSGEKNTHGPGRERALHTAASCERAVPRSFLHHRWLWWPSHLLGVRSKTTEVVAENRMCSTQGRDQERPGVIIRESQT